METTKKVEISASEWRIMRVVWTLKKVTAQQISDVMLKKTDWTESTVKTLIGRLVKKGYLKKDDSSRPFLYSALVVEQSKMEEELNELIEAFCAHHVGTVLGDVLQKTELAQSDIEQLIKMLEEKKRTAPEMVKCNCI